MSKGDGQAAAGGSTALATGAALLGPVGVGFAIGFGIGQGAVLVATAVADSVEESTVDPSPDFLTLPVVKPVTFRRIDAPEVVDAALNGFAVQAASLIDSSRLLYQSVSKLLGALQAQDQSFALLHRLALNDIASRMTSDLRLLAHSCRIVGNLCYQPPIDAELKKITLSRDEVRKILKDIYKNKEIPECEKIVFEDAALTDNEKRLFFKEINQIDVNRLPDVLKAQEIFHLLGRGLDKIIIEEFLVDLPRVSDLCFGKKPLSHKQ